MNDSHNQVDYIAKGAYPAQGEVIDCSLAMQTPEGIEYVLFPAGIPVRASAWGIDCLIRGVILFGLMIFLSYVLRFTGLWFLFIVNFILDWFYYIIFELVWNGQTPGKRIMGIRVVNNDGTPVTAGGSFIRNLLRFADGFFYLYLIAFICMSLSPGFRRIGDWAGGTLVIYTSRSRLPQRFSSSLQNTSAIKWLKDFPVQTPLTKLGFEEKQGLLIFARRYPLLGKKRADEIAHPWAALLRHNAPCYAQSGEPDARGAGVVSDSEFLLGIARSISGVI